MQMSWLKIAAVALAMVTLAGCGGAAKTNGKSPTLSGVTGTQPVPILAQKSGSDAAFATAQEYLINAAGDTKADLTDLNANFDTQSVVVIALGEVPTGGHEVEITGVQKKGDTLYVQFKVKQPGPDAVTTQAISHPYAAALIPKFTGNVIPEEEVN
jgi:hypothetical protein